MANYYGTTTCEGGKIKKGKEKEVLKIIEKYNFGTGEGDMNVGIERVENRLEVYGNDSAYAYEKTDEDYETECFDDFLNEVSPFLAKNFIVKEVGNEKCRYVIGFAYIVKPNKKCISVSLDEAIQQALKKK